MLQQRNAPQSSCQSRRKDLNARSVVLRSRSSLASPARPSRSHKQRFVCFKSNNSEPVTATLTSTLPSSIKQKKQALTVSWAGAGVFFFWQLGAMKYLAEKYDLTKVPMVGASGGSLAAVLAACGVNADCVIQKAYDLSVQYNIWERPLGLLGIWGSIIEKQWLDELLPDNAHELCRNRITVVVTTLPDMAQIGVSDFRDKQDLINACMASSHVPFFLDLKLTRTWRGKRCVDGSFPDFFTGLNSELLRNPDGGQAIVFDYFDDTKLQRKGRMDMLEVKTYDEIRRMMQLGYQYAHQLHADGKFDHYELAEVLLQGQHGHMSEVLVPEHSQPLSIMSSAISSSSKSPMGLVLELEQSEAELVEQIKGAAHQQVPCKMQAQTA